MESAASCLLPSTISLIVGREHAEISHRLPVEEEEYDYMHVGLQQSQRRMIKDKMWMSVT